MRLMWDQAAKGLVIGALFGGFGGLGVCVFLIEGNMLFPGDTILIGALIFGVLGFLYGESFFAWLKENWLWFIG